jgi:nitrogen fixation protein FixH
MNMETHQTLQPAPPRREIWPLAIIGTIAIFIAFIVTCVVIMTRSKTELVSANYYEQELNYQEQINKSSRAEKMNKKAILSLTTDAQMLTVDFPQSANEKISGTARFTRPSDSHLDFEVAIEKAPGASYISIPVNKREPGLWLIKMEWKEGANDFYQEEYFRF